MNSIKYTIASVIVCYISSNIRGDFRYLINPESYYRHFFREVFFSTEDQLYYQMPNNLTCPVLTGGSDAVGTIKKGLGI